MNRKILLCFALIAVILPIGVFLTGCGDSGDAPPTPRGVVMVDGSLSWTRIALAEKYFIFAGSERIGENIGPDSTTFLVEDRFHESRITVEAVRGRRDGLRSAPSAPAVIISSGVFTDTEDTVEHDLEAKSWTSIGVTIEPNITKVRFIGQPGVTYNNSSIVVNSRTAPLTIELVNVNAVAANGTNGTAGSTQQNGGNGANGSDLITYHGGGRIPQLTIISGGQSNSLTGGRGGNGGQGGSRSTGGHGGRGGVAVRANNLVIMGNANLTLRGGNGGNGGNGLNTGNVLTYSTNGGNGGGGGAEIDGSQLFTSTTTFEGTYARLNLARSAGGTGGSGHSNGGMGSLSGRAGSQGQPGPRFDGIRRTLTGGGIFDI